MPVFPGVRSAIRNGVRSAIRNRGIITAALGQAVPTSLKQLLFAAPTGQSVYYDGTGPIPDYYLKDFSLGQGDERLPRGQWCYDFDGTDDYVAIPNPTLTDKVSVSAWVNIDTTGAIRAIYGASKSSSSSPPILLRILSGPARANLFVLTSSSIQITGSTTLSTGVWYHIVGTYDGAELRLYVNGVSDATPVVQTGNISSIDNTKIGAWLNGGSLSQPMDGKIYDVRTYNRALTAVEVAYIYSDGVSGTDPTETNLVAHYPCQEESGGIAYDRSPNKSHGTHQSTSAGFHTTDTGVLKSYPNDNGYTVWENVTFTASGHQGIETDFTTGDCAVSCVWPLTGSSSQTGIGLSTASANTVSYNTQVLGVKLDGSIIETGSSVGSITASNNDIVTVRRTSNVLTVEVNGTVQYTKSGTTSGNIKAQSNTYNGTITNRYKLEGVTAWEDGSCALTSATPFYIPAVSDTEDAIGGTPDYVGRCPYPGLAKGYAWDGDGASAYIDIGSSPINMTSSFKCSFKRGDGTRSEIANQGSTGSSRFRVQANASAVTTETAGSLYVQIGDSASELVAADVLPLNEFAEIEVVTSGGVASLYVDGVLQDTVTLIGTLSKNTTLQLLRYSGGSLYNTGCLGYFSITDSGLTTTYYPRNGSTTVDVVKSDGTSTEITSAVQGSMTYTLGDGSWRLPAIENGGLGQFENQLTNSNDFSAWTQQNVTSALDAVIDKPFTGASVYKVAGTSTGTQISVTKNTNFFDGLNTYSVYAKAGTLQFIRLQCINVNDTLSKEFDLVNGTASGTGAVIESIGNGWYRCTGYYNQSVDLAGAVKVIGLEAFGDPTFITNPTPSDYFYLSSPQVNSGNATVPYTAAGSTAILSNRTLPAAEDGTVATNGEAVNVDPGQAPLGIEVDREGGIAAPLHAVMGTDAYTGEKFNGATTENNIDKRRVGDYSSDRYGAALVDISAEGYFDA